MRFQDLKRRITLSQNGINPVASRDQILKYNSRHSLQHCKGTLANEHTSPLNQHLWCRGHHACLSSWETRVQSLVGPSTQGLKIIEEKVLPLH